MKNLQIILLSFLCQFVVAQEEMYRFELSAGDLSYIDCPVEVDLSIFTPEILKKLSLFEEIKGNFIRVDFQIEPGYKPKMWFIIRGVFEKGESKSYVIVKDTPKEQDRQIQVTWNIDELTVTDGGRHILCYRLSEKLPPEGVDPIYRRSGYIHPLFSPGGERLTRIQPPDHYHHYGIWNPYTLTRINKRKIDFWNLAKGEGTVRFAGLLSITEGSLFGGFEVHQEHLDLKAPEFDRLVINETWDVRYWNASKDGSRYTLDLNIQLSSAIEDTIFFDAYRYGGGIGFRATEEWRNNTCTVLSSEGKHREEADGTRAKWCIVEGASQVHEGRSGILFLSHPFNREHPEPMRVWPADVHEGQMFFEFCPIRYKSWEIVYGKKYSLFYRMIIFDGKMTAREAEMYWNSFANPPDIL